MMGLCTESQNSVSCNHPLLICVFIRLNRSKHECCETKEGQCHRVHEQNGDLHLLFGCGTFNRAWVCVHTERFKCSAVLSVI